MAIAHIVVLSAASLTLLSVPCVVAAVRAPRRWWTRRGREEKRDLRRLDRHLRGDAAIPTPAGPPPIEQIASDLRRLGRQRYDGPNLESAQWQSAVLQAYDLRLALACRCLGLDEHLEPLEGMDRDLERMRVECTLQAAGLDL